MIYFITGGARSGKSSYAMKMALSMSDNPVYVATARKWDDDFQERITRHINDRDQRWSSVEVEKELSKINLVDKVALIDCVTLWLTNLFVDNNQDIDKCQKEAEAELSSLARQKSRLIIVSNELGMGMHAETQTGRKFTDLQGWINQYIAALADEVIFMVSGIPVKIKPPR